MTLAALAIAFHQPVTALLSSFFSGKAFAAETSDVARAGAEEKDAATPAPEQNVRSGPTISSTPPPAGASKAVQDLESAPTSSPTTSTPEASVLESRQPQSTPASSLTPSTLGGAGTGQELQSAPTSSPTPSTPEGAATQPALQSAPTSSPTQSPQKTTLVDVMHKKISERLLTTADWMDSFFADKNYVKEVNKSYVRFRYEIFREERGALSLKPAFDLRLKLPELERKTHLVFSAEPAPATGPNAPVKTAAERFGAATDANLTTALQYFFRTAPKENAFIMTGVQLSQFKPVLFVSPRYRALFPYAVWQLRFTEEVLWRTDIAWESDTRFELERQLPEDFFFRTTLDGVWASQTAGYLYSLGFLLREPFGPNHAVDYEWINEYQTEPFNGLTQIDFRIRYRHNFWREWLFFEVSPQVRFPRDHNFDRIPGILFRLEMFFGRS